MVRPAETSSQGQVVRDPNADIGAGFRQAFTYIHSLVLGSTCHLATKGVDTLVNSSMFIIHAMTLRLPILHIQPLSQTSPLHSLPILLNLFDKRLGIRFPPQKVLITQSAHARLATTQTHLERLHIIPTPTHQQNLVPVQLSKRRIQRRLFKHRRVHVRSKHERVGVPTTTWSTSAHERRKKRTHSTPHRTHRRYAQTYPVQACTHPLAQAKSAPSARSTTGYSPCSHPNCCCAPPDQSWQKRAGGGRTTRH